MQRRQTLITTLSYLFLSISSFIMIYPVLFMALGAFTTNDRFLEATILPIPNTFNVALFARAMAAGVWDSYLFTLYDPFGVKPTEFTRGMVTTICTMIISWPTTPASLR